MDFSWNDQQRELHDQVLSFARARLNPALGVQESGLDRRTWGLLGEFGLTGLCAPLESGGMGFDAQTTACAMEALGRGCPDGGVFFALSAHLFAALRPIVAFGSEVLKAATLAKLTRGEWIGANAISEAGAGSDVFALKSRAERRGDRYLINGTKSYVTNGPLADLFVVYAVTEPKHGYLGLSAFAIPRDTRGLVIGAPFAKMGLKSAATGSLYLEDCEVPLEMRIGNEGAGAKIFKHSMLWERSCLFAGYVGQMARQLERSVAYAREREQFGGPIARHQAVSHRLADMKVRLESARLLLYRACYALDEGARDVELHVAMAKLGISEAAIQTNLDAMQIHGGAGYLQEVGVEQGLRDAMPATIFSGTSEVQRNTIAKWLGL